MKRKNYLIFTLLILFSCFNLKSENNQVYINPTPGEITIMAIDPIPQGIDPSPAAYKSVIDCGFNLVSAQGSVAYFNNVFSILGDMKLKYLISNPHFINKDVRESYIKAFKNNPHLGGWLLRDEPPYDIIDNISEAYKAFYKECPDKFIYVNLVGVVEKYFTGPSPSLNDYIQTIQNKLKPALWSYDFYPIITKQGKTTVEYDLFFTALEDFSSMAKSTNRPFWAFCESLAYTAKSYSRPAPTLPYLRFEAFNALGYGAQGIVYWTYSQRKPNDMESYSTSLVNLKGKKTAAWYYAQKVNKEIKKFNYVFYQCNVKEVKHTGDKLYKKTHRLSGSFGPFKMVRSGASGVMISLIENQGKTYVVAVNHDVTKKQKVTFELQPNMSVTQLTGSLQKTYNWKKDININLDKGDWVIFKVN